MERMSPLDATFLHVEDGINHMHIASCAIFEGPPPPYEDLVELFRSKIPLVPRYRQKVRFVPGALGRPVWVDDPHFNLEYHVRHTALASPGDEAALLTLMGRLMSQELDRHRPLWETWFVEGLADGTWALISKVHHCMVDGISGTDLMNVILDQDRNPTATPAFDGWRPLPEPTGSDLVRHAMAEALASPAEMARWMGDATRKPREVAAQVAGIVKGARSLGTRLRPNVALSIEGAIGPHRRWVAARTTLDEVRTVKAAFGGSVNDIVLTAITQGYRSLLRSRGEPVDDVTLHTLVPVSLRAFGDTTHNNQVAAIIAELPVGIADPVECLEAIKAQMQEMKGSHQVEASTALFNVAEVAPPLLFAATLRSLTLLLRRMPQRGVNTVTTNVPGPQTPLYACGREMLEYLPFVPLAQGLRTGIAILSYHGKIAFGVTGDWDTMPDLAVLGHGIEEGMSALLAAAAKKSRAASRRAPSRRPRRAEMPAPVRALKGA